MKNYVRYMVSSIIMDGAKESRTIGTARAIAKYEAVKLSQSKKYPKDKWVFIDKYNLRTHRNVTLEVWRLDRVTKRYIHRKV